MPMFKRSIIIHIHRGLLGMRMINVSNSLVIHNTEKVYIKVIPLKKPETIKSVLFALYREIDKNETR